MLVNDDAKTLIKLAKLKIS